jgi:uncharacterized membrane protein HdeD (DUF308 family)
MRDRSGFGWLALIVSILLVLLGIATFIWPEAALESFVMVYGVLAVATGIMDIVFYARAERHTGFGPMTALVSGILSVMCGFMLLVYPSAGQWAMTLLFPLWFLTHCISNLTYLNWVRLTAGRVNYTISLILNILGIVLATLMLLHPVLSAVSMSLTIGFYLILLGVDGIVLALSGMGR